MSIKSVMPSSYLILCHSLRFLPPIRVFSNESTLHMRWPKYWSFSFSIIPSKKTPRTDLLQNGLFGSPCSPRDSQESSPTLWLGLMNFELACLLETELNILGNGEACCELCIFNYVNIPASQFQFPIKHFFFSKNENNLLYHLLIKFSTPSKSLGFQRLAPFW